MGTIFTCRGQSQQGWTISGRTDGGKQAGEVEFDDDGACQAAA